MLVRRNLSAAEPSSGRSVCAIVAGGEAPSEDDWRVIDDLYRALRRGYRGEPKLYMHFFEKRDAYLRAPFAPRLVDIVEAAEALGRGLLEREDPPEVRRAIDALEGRIRDYLALRRVPVKRGTPFRQTDYPLYMYEEVEVRGYSEGRVVRVVKPAYETEERNGAPVHGVLLITPRHRG